MKVTTWGALAIAAALAVLLALEPAGAATGGTKVGLRDTALGRILVGPNGHSLYLFVPDKRSQSTCYKACAAAWPPLLTGGKPIARAGVKLALLGTVKRRDGTLQVTYNRHPLYYFAGDRAAGQVRGEGAKNAWFVLSAAGKKITGARAQQPAPLPDDGAPTTPEPPPVSDDPGYGYGG